MSSPSDSNSHPQPLPAKIKISEVRYSLPDLLEELKAERASASFAMEQLDQREIGKIFKSKSSRAKSKK
jgi:hypothetical protein